MQTIQLRDGHVVPALGFGTFQIWDENQAQQAVAAALAKGYRMIDTAAGYFNEAAVGKAIAASAVPRDQITVTTKLWPTDASYTGAKVAVTRSLKKLKLDYIDLYLIHQPFGDYYGVWRALVELQKAGVLRSIGVSNFGAAALVDLALFSGVTPAVDQIQLNPYRQQILTRKEAAKLGVTITAWRPLSQGQEDKTLQQIAQNHGATVAQVALKWALQQHIIVIPKTLSPKHLKANLAAQDLELTAADMAAISALDRHPDEIGPRQTPELLRRVLQIDPNRSHQA